MRAQDKERVGALRLVLVGAPEGREGGRGRRAGRPAPRAQAPPRRRGRSSATPAATSCREEAREAELIETYLPAELSDDELDALVQAADRRDDRRHVAARHGPRDQARHGRLRRARRRRARRPPTRRRQALASLMARRQHRGLQRGRRRARRLAGPDAARARGATSPARSSCAATSSRWTATPRRSPTARRRARAVEPRRARPRDRAGDDRVGHARARPGPLADAGARGRRLAPPQPARRAEVGQPEALRRRHPLEHGHVRHRPGRHRQDLPGDRDGRRRAVAARGQPHHPHPPRGRGRRAARLPARAT